MLAVGRNRPFVLTRPHRSLQRRIRRRPVENFVPLLKPGFKTNSGARLLRAARHVHTSVENIRFVKRVQGVREG